MPWRRNVSLSLKLFRGFLKDYQNKLMNHEPELDENEIVSLLSRHEEILQKLTEVMKNRVEMTDAHADAIRMLLQTTVEGQSNIEKVAERLYLLENTVKSAIVALKKYSDGLADQIEGILEKVSK